MVMGLWSDCSTPAAAIAVPWLLYTATGNAARANVGAAALSRGIPHSKAASWRLAAERHRDAGPAMRR